MKIISSYKVQILPSNKLSFKGTIQIYRKAIAYLIDVYSKEWDAISAIAKKYDRFVFSENLVHTTKGSKAKYDFDTVFYKMPSYLRRAAINGRCEQLPEHSLFVGAISRGQETYSSGRP